MTALPFRILIVLLAAAVLFRPAVELSAVLQAQQLLAGDTFSIVVVLQFLNAAIGGLIAIALAWYAPAVPAARALALLVVLWPALIGGLVTPSNALLAQLANLIQIASILFAIAAFLRFSALFPRVLPTVPTTGRGAIGSLTNAVRRASLRGTVVWTTPAVILLAVIATLALPAGTARAALEMGIATVAAVLTIFALYAGGLNLRVGYSTASTSERKKLFWLLEGLLVFALGFFILPFVLIAVLSLLDVVVGLSENGWEWFHPLLQATTMLLSLLCFALAMFYDGAIDARSVVGKTTLYGAVTIMAVFLFAGIESVVAGVMANMAGQWLSAGLAALCVMPVHNWLRERIGKWKRSPGLSVDQS